MNNILFISPDTFGYYRRIEAAISRTGACPIWLNQLPSTSIASRVLFRIFPRLAPRAAQEFFERQLDKIPSVQQILIIKGEGISEAIIKSMRLRYPDARIVLYLWDSIANTPGAERKIELCDLAFSFDPVDCERIGALRHLPLFHSSDREPTASVPGFAAFIGTLHSDRYRLIRSIGNKIKHITGVPPFIYFYYPNRALFYVNKIINPSFRRVKPTDVNFRPVPRDQYTAIEADAQILIDICHPKQSGLTMRTIEAVGGGKKLITNNPNIRGYDFFCADNIYVVESEPGKDFESFLDKPHRPLSPALVARYHIDSWVRTLLDIRND